MSIAVGYVATDTPMSGLTALVSTRSWMTDTVRSRTRMSTCSAAPASRFRAKRKRGRRGPGRRPWRAGGDSVVVGAGLLERWLDVAEPIHEFTVLLQDTAASVLRDWAFR